MKVENSHLAVLSIVIAVGIYLSYTEIKKLSDKVDNIVRNQEKFGQNTEKFVPENEKEAQFVKEHSPDREPVGLIFKNSQSKSQEMVSLGDINHHGDKLDGQEDDYDEDEDYDEENEENLREELGEELSNELDNLNNDDEETLEDESDEEESDEGHSDEGDSDDDDTERSLEDNEQTEDNLKTENDTDVGSGTEESKEAVVEENKEAVVEESKEAVVEENKEAVVEESKEAVVEESNEDKTEQNNGQQSDTSETDQESITESVSSEQVIKTFRENNKVDNMGRKLAKLTLKDLKSIAGELGLVQKGLKEDVVNRIINHADKEKVSNLYTQKTIDTSVVKLN